jgi:hypothetical protein
MLRGQVPTDRNSDEIVFDKLEEVDDMWTMLFYNMLRKEDVGELWYWGGKREKKFTTNFTERWVSNFKKYKTDFKPDIIFCRGGFPEYHTILKRYPDAIKIYYGAGRRFLPQKGFHNYDIILQDSKEQEEICRSKFPNAVTSLFKKPAADNIFYSHKVEKKFDVCFPANGTQRFKGHDFVYPTAPKDLKILNLGNNSTVRKPKNIKSYRVLRTDMAKNISMCKVGIVATRGNIDSCPRVIPEMLACNLPIIVLDRVRFWKEMYIESLTSSRRPLSTGELANTDSFWDLVRFVLENIDLYEPRKYYDVHLSLEQSAFYIRLLINNALDLRGRKDEISI